MNTNNAQNQIKNSKKERKERSGLQFNLGFFTKGTQCVVNVNSHRSNEDQIVTVNKVIKNGPNSYVITTGVMREHTGEEGFHISHVKSIIKQVPGHVVIENTNGYTKTLEDGTEVFVDYREEYFKTQHGGSYDPSNYKHPSQYRTWSFDKLTRFIAEEYLKPDQVYDVEKLTKLILDRHLVKVDRPSDGWGVSTCTVNKKKFRQAIKQLLPKCLCSPYKTQRDHDEAMEEMYARDMEAELDRERKSDSGRSDIYEVEKNEYGYPQTMQEGGEGQNDSPVCSCCHACVMPNRGQGTACDTCQNEADMEMSHDYDMGGFY